MRLIEVNYSLQDLHLEFKNSTGEYVDNIATNLNNPYVKWLEEIAIKSKKSDLTDQEIHRLVMEEIAEQKEESEDTCDCKDCGCNCSSEEYLVKFERSKKQLENGEVVTKTMEELEGFEIPDKPSRISFNEHNK